MTESFKEIIKAIYDSLSEEHKRAIALYQVEHPEDTFETAVIMSTCLLKMTENERGNGNAEFTTSGAHDDAAKS